MVIIWLALYIFFGWATLALAICCLEQITSDFDPSAVHGFARIKSIAAATSTVLFFFGGWLVLMLAVLLWMIG